MSNFVFLKVKDKLFKVFKYLSNNAISTRGTFFFLSENVQCFRILGVPETKGACKESKLWQALWGIYNILNDFDGSITLTGG